MRSSTFFAPGAPIQVFGCLKVELWRSGDFRPGRPLVDRNDTGALSPRNTRITYRSWLTQPVLLQE